MIFHYLFRLLCFEYCIMPIEYFMDKLQAYEINIILENLSYTKKLEWELTRIITYMVAQSQCSKQLKPTDIMNFVWDGEFKNIHSEITNKQISDIKDTAKMFENILKKQNS